MTFNIKIVSLAVLVSNSQVVGCEDRIRNDLYGVGWGVKLYSIQSNSLTVQCRTLITASGNHDLHWTPISCSCTTPASYGIGCCTCWMLGSVTSMTDASIRSMHLTSGILGDPWYTLVSACVQSWSAENIWTATSYLNYAEKGALARMDE